MDGHKPLISCISSLEGNAGNQCFSEFASSINTGVYLQQLVQAWKEMAQRERASAGTEQSAGIPATLPGIDKEQPQKRPKVAQAAKTEEDVSLSTMPLFATGNPALNENGLPPVDMSVQQA